MKRIANKSFPLFYLKESELEEKYRTKEGLHEYVKQVKGW